MATCLVVPQTGTLKDYGLRAKEDIKKGDFVIEYVGEVIDQEEFEDRLDEYRVRGVGKLPRSDCRVILNGLPLCCAYAGHSNTRNVVISIC